MENIIMNNLENIVLNQLKKFPDVPKNYHPEIKIFRVLPIRSEDQEELSKRICYGLKNLNFPSYYAHFYGVGYRPVEGVQELLKCFCTFLDFTIINPAQMSRCDKVYCPRGIDEKLYADCINTLNEIAMYIVNFAFNKQTRNMGNSEMIIRFFNGEFFKKVDKNIFGTIKCPDNSCKYLLIETAKCLFQFPKSPELLQRVQKLCRTLLDEIKNLFLFEERLQEEEKKKQYSKGGRKKSSKYNDLISPEQKEAFYNEFKVKFPDSIIAYKEGKRGPIKQLSNFIWEKLRDKEPTLEIPESTTKKWASDLLKKHRND